MKKRLAALCVAAAICTPVAFAQNAAPAAVPAAAPAADPAAVAAAREMLVSMNYRVVVTGMLAQMRQSMPAMMQQSAVAAIDNNPKLDAAQKAAAHEKLKTELPKAMAVLDGVFGDDALIDEMMADTVQTYARHFTAAELHQIAAFYKTPVGAKSLALMPQIANEAMQSSQRIVMPRISAAMQKLAAQ
jgi:hypothetical protein